MSENCFATRSRSTFNCLNIEDTSAMSSPLRREIVAEARPPTSLQIDLTPRPHEWAAHLRRKADAEGQITELTFRCTRIIFRARLEPNWPLSFMALREKLSSVEPLTFSKRVVIVGALTMITAVAFVCWVDFHPPFTSDNAMRLFTRALFLFSGLAAVIVLTGYILVSWALPPVKAMAFGILSVGLALLLPFGLEPILGPIAERFPNLFLSHEGALLLSSLLLVFVAGWWPLQLV
jgi:hypothetical protein